MLVQMVVPQYVMCHIWGLVSRLFFLIVGYQFNYDVSVYGFL